MVSIFFLALVGFGGAKGTQCIESLLVEVEEWRVMNGHGSLGSLGR